MFFLGRVPPYRGASSGNLWLFGGGKGVIYFLWEKGVLSLFLSRPFMVGGGVGTHPFQIWSKCFLRGLPKLLLCQISLDVRLFFFFSEKKNLPLGGFEPPALLFILDLISDSLFSLSLSHFSALVYFHRQSNFVGWRPTAHNQPGVMLAPDGQLRKGVKK